jgi:hypothetical protein
VVKGQNGFIAFPFHVFLLIPHRLYWKRVRLNCHVTTTDASHVTVWSVIGARVMVHTRSTFATVKVGNRGSDPLRCTQIHPSSGHRQIDTNCGGIDCVALFCVLACASSSVFTVHACLDSGYLYCKITAPYLLLNATHQRLFQRQVMQAIVKCADVSWANGCRMSYIETDEQLVHTTYTQ